MHKATVQAARATCVAVALLLAAGCSPGEVQISKAAVREAGNAVGNDSVSVIKLSKDDVTRLAEQAGVGDDVIRDTAPDLDNQSLWSSALGDVTDLYRDTPGEVRSNLVSIACDGARGQITSEQQLEQNVAARFTGYTPDQFRALVESVREMWQDLHDASTSDDPNRQAAAVLACFTVEQIVG